MLLCPVLLTKSDGRQCMAIWIIGLFLQVTQNSRISPLFNYHWLKMELISDQIHF